MRILLLLLSTVFALAGCDDPTPVCGSECGEPKEPEPEDEGDLVAGPDATPDSLDESRWLVDFGPTALGRIETRKFRIRNRGQGLLVPTVRVREGEFSAHAPSSIRPGEEAEVHFFFQPGEERVAQAIAQISAGKSVIQVRLVGEGFEPRLACPERHAVRVPTGSTGVFEIVCTNESPAGYSLEAGIAAPFWIEEAPDTVDVDEEAIIQVATNVAAPGRSTGTLAIESQGRLVAEVELDVEVVAPAVFVCDRDILTFESVVIGLGTSLERQVVQCRNEGVGAAPAIVTAPAAFAVEVDAEPIEPDAVFEVALTFAPSTPEVIDEFVSIVPDGALSPSDGAEVRVEATALALPVCELELAPTEDGTFHFHTLPSTYAGWPRRELALKVSGEGCAIENLRIEGDAAFQFAQEPPASFFVPPGEMGLPIDFRPVAAGSYEAMLSFQVVGEESERAIRLAGAKADCLFLRDEFGWPADFFVLQNDVTGCGGSVARLHLQNSCDEPVTITGATVQERWPAQVGHFEVVEEPALPAELAPGETAAFTISYSDPASAAREQGGITIDLEDGTRVWVELEGTWYVPDSVTEHAHPDWSGDDAVDVLFVVENGEDGNEAGALLFHRYGALVNNHPEWKTWRMAFTTTAGAPCARPAGALHAVLDQESGTADLFNSWVAPGTCAGAIDPFGAGLAAMDALEALEGGWPDAADLHVVFLTSAFQEGVTPAEAMLEDIAARVRAGARPVTVHAVRPPIPDGQPNQPYSGFHVAARATSGRTHFIDGGTSVAPLRATIFRNFRLHPLRYPVPIPEEAESFELGLRVPQGDDRWVNEPAYVQGELADRWRYLPLIGAVRLSEHYRFEGEPLRITYSPQCEPNGVTDPSMPPIFSFGEY